MFNKLMLPIVFFVFINTIYMSHLTRNNYRQYKYNLGKDLLKNNNVTASNNDSLSENYLINVEVNSHINWPSSQSEIRPATSDTFSEKFHIQNSTINITNAEDLQNTLDVYKCNQLQQRITTNLDSIKRSQLSKTCCSAKKQMKKIENFRNKNKIHFSGNPLINKTNSANSNGHNPSFPENSAKWQNRIQNENTNSSSERQFINQRISKNSNRNYPSSSEMWRRWSKELSSFEISCDEAQQLLDKSGVTLPPDVCGLCPGSLPSSGLYPCKCSNNGGFLGGTINIDCPPEVSSQLELRDIIERTTFLVTNVSRFSLESSNISGVLNLDILAPLTVMNLIFNHDQFYSVDNHAFNSSKNTLKSISIANNPLTYFHFESLNEIANLTSVYITGNCLEFIPSEAFMHPKLHFLDLSDCQISVISDDAFAGLRKIEVIGLSNNSLTELIANTFRIPDHDVNKVLQIDVSYNYIEYISPDAFSFLKNVNLNLKANFLSTLDEAVFHPLIVASSFFAYFLVEGNPINCDCGISWIVRDRMLLNCFDNFRCVDQNATLYQLDPNLFENCP